MYSNKPAAETDRDGKSNKLSATWARICKRLWSIGIDPEESILPAYVAWRAGTPNRAFVLSRRAGNRFLGSLKDLQIRALSPNLYFKEPRNQFRYDRPVRQIELSYHRPGYIDGLNRFLGIDSWSIPRNRILGSFKINKFGLWLVFTLFNDIYVAFHTCYFWLFPFENVPAIGWRHSGVCLWRHQAVSSLTDITENIS